MACKQYICVNFLDKMIHLKENPIFEKLPPFQSTGGPVGWLLAISLHRILFMSLTANENWHVIFEFRSRPVVGVFPTLDYIFFRRTSHKGVTQGAHFSTTSVNHKAERLKRPITTCELNMEAPPEHDIQEDVMTYCGEKKRNRYFYVTPITFFGKYNHPFRS